MSNTSAELSCRPLSPIWHDPMTHLSLASNQAEARKFSRDAKMRSSTPEPEVVRSKAPAVSRGWRDPAFPREGDHPSPEAGELKIDVRGDLAGIFAISLNRDRGQPRGCAPPTPPDVRVRIRRFGGLCRLWVRDGSQTERPEGQL